jgi:hypothetical protein
MCLMCLRSAAYPSVPCSFVFVAYICLVEVDSFLIAMLYCVVLFCVVLCCVMLCRIVLYCVVLCSVVTAAGPVREAPPHGSRRHAPGLVRGALAHPAVMVTDQ